MTSFYGPGADQIGLPAVKGKVLINRLRPILPLLRRRRETGDGSLMSCPENLALLI